MKIKFLLMPILLAAGLCAAAGYSSCTGKDAAPNRGPARSGAEGFPLVLADALGRDVVLDARPARLVSLSPSLTEILFAIGAGDQLVGVTEYCDHPPEAAEKPKVGGVSGVTVNVERIASINPDLVLVSGDMHQRIIELLDRLGIQSYAVEPRTFDDVYRAIEVLGRLTENSAGAERVLAEMRGKTARAGELRGGRERPRVFWELNPDPLMTIGGGNWINDAITAAGGVNIFGDAPNQYPQVGLEQVILKQPEWIMVAEYGAMGTSAANFAGRPGWARIPAIRTGSIGSVDADSLYRFGPRLADATLAIAEILFGTPLHSGTPLPGGD